MQTVAGVGGSLLRARPEGTYRIDVPIPKLSEQKRIAAILDKADAIRRKRQQAIRLADDFLRSVFLEMFGDLVTNQHRYAVGTIRDLVAEVRYGTSTKANTLGEGMPVLRMNNITYAGGWDFSELKHVELDPTEADKYTVQPGDILFNRTNSKELVGKTAVYPEREPMAFAGYLVRARLNDRGNPYYVSAYLNSEHGKKTLVGMCKSIVGMANINAQEVQDIPILLPPKEVQDRFANRCRAVERSRSRYKKSALEAATLNAALSDQFFSK
ncbi:MAG: restriction endonuclease subunit S [Panacagrimonas sp.]